MKRIAQYVADTTKNVKTYYRLLIGRISSVSSDGKIIHAEAESGGEVRDMKSILPYGISSSPLDNMMTQIIMNGNNYNSAMGVYDSNRPPALPGEIIIYNNNTTIKLDKEGNIKIDIDNGNKVSINGHTIFGGDKGVARYGDTVEVYVPDIGTCTGVITGASSNILID